MSERQGHGFTAIDSLHDSSRLSKGICGLIMLWYNARVMESVIVEIRAAEGGDDAKDLVHEQFSIYTKLGARRFL